jgi:O-antigen/teichoic acid export membrane protein
MMPLANWLGTKNAVLRAALRDPLQRRRLVDEFAILFSRAVMVLASIVTSAVTARILGPALRGDYFYCIATGSLLAQFACLGLPSANIYFAAHSPKSLRPIVAATAVLTVAACGLVTIMFMVLTSHTGFVTWRVAIGGWLLFAFAGASMLSTTVPVLLAGLQRYVAMSAAQIAASLAGVVLVLLTAYYAPGLVNFTLVALFSALLVSVAALALVVPQLRDGPWLDGVFLRGWATFALRAVPSLVLGYLLARGTIYSARATLASEVFGIFTIAYQVFEALINIPQTIAMVLFPKIAKSGDFSRRLLVSECCRAALLCTVFGGVAVLITVPLIAVVYGQTYAPATAILIWYFPALIAYAVVAICNQFLSAMHFPLFMNLAWAGCAVITIVLAYGGGRHFSGVGVAIGTSIGWSIAAVVFFILTDYEIGARNRRVPDASAPQGLG